MGLVLTKESFHAVSGALEEQGFWWTGPVSFFPALGRQHPEAPKTEPEPPKPGLIEHMSLLWGTEQHSGKRNTLPLAAPLGIHVSTSILLFLGLKVLRQDLLGFQE